MISIDRSKYYQQGYSDRDIDEAIQELQQEETEQNNLQSSYNRVYQQNQINPSQTLFSNNYNDNLIKWQTEFDKDLERIEHILRGDKPTNINGSIVFLPAKNDKDKMFNDEGVAQIMQIIHMYLNKNTILSNYDEETINNKMFDFGIELSNLIFCKYQEMGLRTLEKRKRYSMIVRELVDSVHSAYLRALNGGERESLRTARNITQSEVMSNTNPMTGMPLKERSPFNPMRLLKGKYY